MENFKTKVIWITGASSGFGEAMAYAFAKEGAQLILSARRIDELERVKANIDRAAVLPLDLLKPELFDVKVNTALAIYGHIDLVIHNGGLAQNSLALDTSTEVEQKIMQVDFFSYTQLTKLLLPHFIARRAGHIVVVSGVLGKVAMPFRTSYCAAKAALHGYFDSLRAEVLPHNIFVTVLIPSFLKTSLTAHAEGVKSLETPISTGCSVDKAAKQVVKAVKRRKFQAVIGDFDKGRLLLWIGGIWPSLAIKMILKQTKAS